MNNMQIMMRAVRAGGVGGSDKRLIKPYITDADDLYAFDNIEQMQSEIQSIRGFRETKMIRLDRFVGSDKARIHYRVISETNDGSGVPVRIDISTNPQVAKYVDRFANIAIGFPYYVPGTDESEVGKIVYWDGNGEVEVGSGPSPKGFFIASEEEFAETQIGGSGFYPLEVRISGNGWSERKWGAKFQVVIDGKVKTDIPLEEFIYENNTWTPIEGQGAEQSIINIEADSSYDTSGGYSILCNATNTEEKIVIVKYKTWSMRVIVEAFRDR